MVGYFRSKVLAGIALLCGSVYASQAQYTNDKIDFTVSSSTSDDASTYYMTISAPTSYGWAAVGTGKKMRDSLMFVIYPSGDGTATLSVRTASGENTPSVISDFAVNTTSSVADSDTMTAAFNWQSDELSTYSTLDASSTDQSFIWAVGPDQTIASSSTSAGIKQHSAYGSFTLDMTTAQTTTNTTAANSTSTASSTFASSTSATTSSSSTGRKSEPDYWTLVTVHAALLAVAFVILMPGAVILLRLPVPGSFHLHWIFQLIATLCSFSGLGVAIYFSYYSYEWSSFDNYHQIIGIVVVGLVVMQVALGVAHHTRWKIVRRRTVVSWAHIGLGRLIIYGGMVNAILGFLLVRTSYFATSTALAGACGAVALIFAIGMEAASWFATRRNRKQRDGSVTDSTEEPLAVDERDHTPTKAE